tara:strand:- start:36 stop:599 length:564 start_codon:yes stop_codon:yes gene_type:complete
VLNLLVQELFVVFLFRKFFSFLLLQLIFILMLFVKPHVKLLLLFVTSNMLSLALLILLVHVTAGENLLSALVLWGLLFLNRVEFQILFKDLMRIVGGLPIHIIVNLTVHILPISLVLNLPVSILLKQSLMLHFLHLVKLFFPLFDTLPMLHLLSFALLIPLLLLIRDVIVSFYSFLDPVQPLLLCFF